MTRLSAGFHIAIALALLRPPAPSHSVRKIVKKHTKSRGDTEWRVTEEPKNTCGWGVASCWDTTADAKTEDTLCKGIGTKEAYLKESGLFTKGCNTRPFETVCLATVNDGNKQKKGQHNVIADKCAGADVIVFAMQEIQRGFGAFPTTSEYSLVGRCEMGSGMRRGPSVSVFAKSKERYLFLEEQCERIREPDPSLTNMKGSVVMTLHTVSQKGTVVTLVAASSHGARKGPDPEKARAQGFGATAEAILGASPAFVAWGGDFNMRTEMDGLGELPSLVGEYTGPSGLSPTPKEVGEKLRATEDFLATGVKWGEELQKAGKGKLVDIDVRGHLCPSYYKAAATVTTGGGMLSLFGGSKKKTERRKRLACQATDGGPVEYYLHPDDGETNWGNTGRAPSWTERLIVSQSLECGTAEKIIANEDHDTVYTKCTVV